MNSTDTLLESLRLFAQTAKILNRTLNRGELIDILLEESHKISSTRVTTLYLKDVESRFNDIYIISDGMKRSVHAPGLIDSGVTDHFSGINESDRWRMLVNETFNIDVHERLRLPVLRHGSILGYLDLYDPQDESARKPQFLEVLNALVDLFVIAWDNAELYEQMRKKSLENNLLLDSARMLSSSLDLDEVLHDMMLALKNVVDYDAVGIFLVKRDTNKVEPRVWQGYEGTDCRRRLSVKVGEGLIGWVIKNGEGVYVPDTKADDRYVESRPETQCELVVPIKADAKIIGAFNVESNEIDAYSEDDLQFLTVFASQAVISIERARLYKEIMATRQLEEQLNVARMIQRTFLPRKNPTVAGFDIAGKIIPSQKVGGDYYDFIEIVKNQMGIAIADVSGKGMPASLIMASFRASLIAEIRNNYAIRTILQKVNRLLNESMDRGNFVTAVYGVLDSKNRIFTFSNAGHNPPVLIRKDGSYEELTEGGLALGIIDNRDYEERPVYVARGDMIMLYTDGVTEGRDSEDELFGEKRLMKIVMDNREKTAKEIVQLVVDSVHDFVREDYEQDDLTLIVVKAL